MGELGVDVVVESTGRFTSRDAAAVHLDAGARKVVISAPGAGADATIVMGVNDDTYDGATQHVISNASCTTNCFVPMVKVLDDAFTLTSGLMTTVHAYTNDQNILDFPHKDLRRARAAAINIIPSSTGAARASESCSQSIQGRLDGSSLRVPVPDGIDHRLHRGRLGRDGRRAGQRRLQGRGGRARSRDPRLHRGPIVSTDIVGKPASCTFDSGLTMVQAIDETSSLVKVLGWYDNEWGYSNRMVTSSRSWAVARVGALPRAAATGGRSP